MFGSGLVLGFWLSWVWVEQSSFLTIFFYDFSVFDFWVCMIFLGLCSCVFCHLGILNSFFCFFFVFLNLSLCLVLGFFVFFVFLFLIQFLIFLFS